MCRKKTQLKAFYFRQYQDGELVDEGLVAGRDAEDAEDHLRGPGPIRDTESWYDIFPYTRVRNAWHEIDPTDGSEPFMDAKYYQRVIKLPYSHWNDKVRAIVNRWIESNSWRDHCGCPEYCCGCEYQRRATWTYSAGKLTLSVVSYFNY